MDNLNDIAKEATKWMASAGERLDSLRTQLKDLRASHLERTNQLLKAACFLEELMLLAQRSKSGATAEARQLAASLIVEKLLIFELVDDKPACGLCDGARRVVLDNQKEVRCPECTEEG